jgi:peptidoglycan/xylan/chitin deacetylase (PgdA/CDA1 family)
MSKKNQCLIDDTRIKPDRISVPKTICFTIDIEPDFGGLLSSDAYAGLRNLSKLVEIVHKYDLKITAFVTGKTLEDNPEIIDELKSINAEVEQHSYLHLVGRDTPKGDDIEKGIETHRKMMGKSPLGYRAPQGLINLQEVQILKFPLSFLDGSISFPFRNNLSFTME